MSAERGTWEESPGACIFADNVVPKAHEANQLVRMYRRQS